MGVSHSCGWVDGGVGCRIGCRWDRCGNVEECRGMGMVKLAGVRCT